MWNVDGVMCSVKKILPYIVLVGAIAIYACTGVFTRLAADYPFLSWQYILLVCGAVAVLGIYAILWQQIIQRMELGVAYMFKGLGVVFALLICHFVFNEAITLNNVIGAGVIITGITLFARD